MTKTADSAFKSDGAKKYSSTNTEHILPLGSRPDHPTKLDSLNSATFSLRTVPTDADSPTYKQSVRKITGSEDARTLIQWYLQTPKIWVGLNVNQYIPGVALVEATLEGTAAILFDTSLGTQKEARYQTRIRGAANATLAAAVRTAGVDDPQNTHFDHILTAMQHVMKSLLPRRVLARVKRQMRRDTRKPKDMKVRIYFQHLLRQNLEYLPNLPPFRADQSLGDDELLDILLFGTPKSWQREMERQGFDPMVGSLNEVIEFMEQIEATEEFDPSPKTKTKDGQGKKGNKNSGSKKESGEVLYCALHGKGSHSTNDCKTIQSEVKRLKTERSGSQQGSNNKSSSKTWSKKANDEKKKARSDMNAFIKKEVAKGIKKGVKELAAFDKKRKSDDDSDDDLNAFLGEDKIEDFDYSDMDNLKIDSDDEEVDV